MLREPGYEVLLRKIADASLVGVAAPTLAEATIVLSARLGRDARGLLARFLQEGSIVVLPFGDAQYGVAVDAWLRYGKGRHAASLNFGDCLSYAAAIVAGEPLLYVGEDFGHTDVAVA